MLPAPKTEEEYEMSQPLNNEACNLGFGDTAALDPRNPRLEFEEVCALL
jgi:hypothetical protein